MSWLTRIKESNLTITTGDGKVYTPLWKNAIKNINYNTEGFGFIGIKGTFVGREEREGRQFPILLYFTGEDCIDKSNEFEISAEDKRAWKISHPYYDDLLVQPLNLSFDNSQQNVVKITGVVWETIEQKYPDEAVNQFKEIEIKKTEIDAESEAVFVDNIETPSPELIEPANDAIARNGANYNLLVQTDSDAALLKDKIRSAATAANELIQNSTRYIQQAKDLINFPFLIIQSIIQKVQQMLNTFNDFTEIFLVNETSTEKQITYEAQATMLLSELSLVLINTNIEDFEKRETVVNVINALSGAYDAFITNLDDLGYVQDKELSKQLDFIVNFTLGELYDVAFESKQERKFLLDKDDNVTNLAYRFYGTDDDALDLFLSQNNFSLSELLQVKKGREIIYFV